MGIDFRCFPYRGPRVWNESPLVGYLLEWMPGTCDRKQKATVLLLPDSGEGVAELV